MKITFTHGHDAGQSFASCQYSPDGDCVEPSHYSDDEFEFPDTLVHHLMAKMQQGTWIESDMLGWCREWYEDHGLKPAACGPNSDLANKEDWVFFMEKGIDRVLRMVRRRKLVGYDVQTRSNKWIGTMGPVKNPRLL